MHAQAVVGPIQANDQIVGLAGKGHAGGGDPYTQLDAVGVGADRFAIVVVNGVLARTHPEQVSVGARATTEVVVAHTAIQRVVPGIAGQAVVTRSPIEDVTAGTTVKIVSAVSAVEQVIAVLATQAVGAVATVQGIGTFAALQVVGAAVAIQGVVAGIPEERVVAIAATECVGRRVAVQVVVAYGRDHGLGLDSVDIPYRAVGETDFLDLVGAGRVVVEVARHRQLVGRSVDTQYQTVAATADHDIGAGNARRELDRVGLAHGGLVVGDGVLAAAATEQVHIVPCITGEVIVAGTAIEDVTAGTTVKIVVAVATAQGIGTFAALQVVGAAVAIQGVVAGIPEERVVAIAATECVGRRVAVQVVVAYGRDHGLGLDSVDIPYRAVGETDFLDLVGAGRVVVEVARHRQLVGRSVDTQYQTVAATADHDIGAGNARRELDRVGLAHGGLVVGDGVLAAAATEQVHIVPCITGEVIVAGTAIEDVTAGTTVKIVVAVATVQGIGTFTALQVVGAAVAIQGVVACIPEDRILAVSTIECVGGRVAIERIVTTSRDNYLGFYGSDVPYRTIGKADFLYFVRTGRITVEIARHRQPICCAIDTQHQAVARTADLHVSIGNVRRELNRIGLACCHVVVGNSVLAAASAEQVHIVPCVTT